MSGTSNNHLIPFVGITLVVNYFGKGYWQSPPSVGTLIVKKEIVQGKLGEPYVTCFLIFT